MSDIYGPNASAAGASGVPSWLLNMPDSVKRVFGFANPPPMSAQQLQQLQQQLQQRVPPNSGPAYPSAASPEAAVANVQRALAAQQVNGGPQQQTPPIPNITPPTLASMRTAAANPTPRAPLPPPIVGGGGNDGGGGASGPFESGFPEPSAPTPPEYLHGGYAAQPASTPPEYLHGGYAAQPATTPLPPPRPADITVKKKGVAPQSPFKAFDRQNADIVGGPTVPGQLAGGPLGRGGPPQMGMLDLSQLFNSGG